MVEFAKVLAAFKAGNQEIPEGWSQGRACFGGLIGAVMYSALEERGRHGAFMCRLLGQWQRGLWR